MTKHRGFSNIEDVIPNYHQRINHLFAIAIDEYEHCPKLSNAVKDARDVIDILVDKYDFEPSNICTFFDEIATESNILKQFEEYATTLTDNDNLLIYFSGHGEEKEIFKEGYWIPANAEIGNVGQYIPNSTIRNILSAIQTHHTFLIVDSCFSGSLFMSSTRSAVSDRLEKNPSRWGLSSGRNEVVADGTAGTNSPFASSLIYCLKNNTKDLGVQELCSEVLEMTATNAEQTPLGEPLKVDGHRNGQFVFFLKKNEFEDWKTAISENTINGYQRYLKLYASGKHIAEAKAKIEIFREESIWKEALQTHSINAYFGYQNKYPKGKFVNDAFDKIAEIEEENVWKTVSKNNLIGGYHQYLEKFPKGKYHTIANERIQNLVNDQGATGAVITPINTAKSKIVTPENTGTRGDAEAIEKLVNSKHRMYYIISTVVFWLFLWLEVDANFTLLACFGPIYCAYNYPIASKRMFHMLMGAIFGVFVLACIIDLLLGGTLIEFTEGEAIGGALFFSALWYLCYRLNKTRYPVILEKMLKIHN